MIYDIFIKCINTWQCKTLWEILYIIWCYFFVASKFSLFFGLSVLKSCRNSKIWSFVKVFLPSLLFFTCVFSKLLWARSEVCCEHSKGARRCWAAPTRLSALHRQNNCCVSETQDEVDIESHFWFGALLVGWKWIVCGLTTGGLRWEANEC